MSVSMLNKCSQVKQTKSSTSFATTSNLRTYRIHPPIFQRLLPTMFHHVCIRRHTHLSQDHAPTFRLATHRINNQQTRFIKVLKWMFFANLSKFPAMIVTNCSIFIQSCEPQYFRPESTYARYRISTKTNLSTMNGMVSLRATTVRKATPCIPSYAMRM